MPALVELLSTGDVYSKSMAANALRNMSHEKEQNLLVVAEETHPLPYPLP